MIRGFILKKSWFQLTQTQELNFFENGKIEHFDFGGIWGYYLENCQNRHKSCLVVSVYYFTFFCAHSDIYAAETVRVHFHKAELSPVFILPFLHISKDLFVKQKCEKQFCDPKASTADWKRQNFSSFWCRQLLAVWHYKDLSCSIYSITWTTQNHSASPKCIRKTQPDNRAFHRGNQQCVSCTDIWQKPSKAVWEIIYVQSCNCFVPWWSSAKEIYLLTKLHHCIYTSNCNCFAALL